MFDGKNRENETPMEDGWSGVVKTCSFHFIDFYHAGGKGLIALSMAEQMQWEEISAAVYHAEPRVFHLGIAEKPEQELFWFRNMRRPMNTGAFKNKLFYRILWFRPEQKVAIKRYQIVWPYVVIHWKW